MLKTIIHESNKNYIDNRKTLLEYLQLKGHKNPHYVANDIEDNKILSYYMVNIAIILTNNAQESYKEKISNWPGLFYWILQALRTHSLFCNFHGLNFDGKFFNDLNNMNCGFMAPQDIENDLMGARKEDLYNYLLDNPEALKYLNENLKYTKQSNLNISHILLNFSELSHMLNINKLKLNSSYLVKHVKHVARPRAHTHEGEEININFLNQIKLNKSKEIIDISSKNLGYQLCYAYKLSEFVDRNNEKKEKKVIPPKKEKTAQGINLENRDKYILEYEEQLATNGIELGLYGD